MTELYYRRKLERLDAVKRGEWRREDGVILDLFDFKTVPDAYLETIIISSEERERQDNTGIDDQIVEILQQIRKERDFLRNKANKTKKMKTEQLELTGIETAQAAVAASANIKNGKMPSAPQMFKIGDHTHGRKIIDVRVTTKGGKAGRVYTTEHLETGKVETVKESLFTKGFKNPFDYAIAVSKSKKKKAKSASKFFKTEKVEVKSKKTKKRDGSSVIREEFPRIRKIQTDSGGYRYVVDARWNKNFPNGTTEFYEDMKIAFSRANEIALTVVKNINKANTNMKNAFEKASSAKSEPVSTSPTQEDIKKLPFFTKLKLLFSAS